MTTDAVRAIEPPNGRRFRMDPVLITGADRTGTTLLYALVASHPNISMVRRSNIFRWFHGRFGDLADPANARRCVETMVRYQRMSVLAPDPELILADFAAAPKTYGALFAIVHGHRAERIGKPRWGDKSLHGEHWAETIFQEFPDARMIQLVRDPRDRHASVKARYDGRRVGLGSHTARWLDSARAAKRNSARYQGRYLVVRYEDLVFEPERELGRVCDFLDEPYTSEMLLMGGAPDHNDVGGNSSFEPVPAQTISTRSVGRFRKVLEPREIAYLQAVCSRPMARFGYEKDRIDLGRRERVAFVFRDVGVEGAKAVLRRVERATGRQADDMPANRLGPATDG
jgi:hypothetical protein